MIEDVQETTSITCPHTPPHALPHHTRLNPRKENQKTISQNRKRKPKHQESKIRVPFYFPQQNENLDSGVGEINDHVVDSRSRMTPAPLPPNSMLIQRALFVLTKMVVYFTGRKPPPESTTLNLGVWGGASLIARRRCDGRYFHRHRTPRWSH